MAMATFPCVPGAKINLLLIASRSFQKFQYQHRGRGLFAQLSLPLQGEDSTQSKRMCWRNVLIKFRTTSVAQESSGRDATNSRAPATANKTEKQPKGFLVRSLWP